MVSPRTSVPGSRRRPHTARSLTRRASSLTHRLASAASRRFRTAYTQPAELGFGSAGLSTWLTSTVTTASAGAEPSRTWRPAARRHARVEPDHPAVDDGLGLVPVKAPRVRSAHAGGVAPALTESSPEPRDGTCVMVRETTDRLSGAVAPTTCAHRAPVVPSPLKGSCRKLRSDV